MKTILFMISHPAHFHLFRIAMNNLKTDGYEVVTVIRPKDVLEQLCIDYRLDYHKVKERSRTTGKFGMALSIVRRTWETGKIVRKVHPDLMIGCDGVISYLGKLFNIPSFDCDEDDAEATPLFAKLYYPFFTGILSPSVCSAGKWENKKIGYSSYHELAYLHPNHFSANKDIVRKYGINPDVDYFVIRFAQLTAHHDAGVHGIDVDTALQLIRIIEPYGPIYITSERPLEAELEPYRIKIYPEDIHHIMAFASLFIGDSQTMAAEAGVLGTPFVRLNDFAGKLSYLNELENYYQLGDSHKSYDVSGFLSSIQNWIKIHNRKETCMIRRDAMLKDKIDLAKFLTWFIESYPESMTTMKNNPDYQYNFK